MKLKATQRQWVRPSGYDKPRTRQILILTYQWENRKLVKGRKYYKELEEKPPADLSTLDQEMDGKDKEKFTKKMSKKKYSLIK